MSESRIYTEEALDQIEKSAEERERVRIVAWLRSDGGDDSRWGARLDALADAIEQGKHVRRPAMRKVTP